MMTTGVIAALALPGVALGAPQAATGEHEQGFRFYSSAVSAGVDTGIVLDDGKQRQDNVFVLVPTALAYRNHSERGDLQLIYEPALELYQELSQLNNWNQAAAARYGLDASRSVHFETGGSFLKTDDRSRYGSTLTLEPRSPFTEGRVYGSLSYQWNRETQLSGRVDGWYTRTTFSSLDVPEPIEQATGIASVSLSRSLGPLHQVSANYSHLETRVLNENVLPPEGQLLTQEGQDSVNGAYSLRLPSGLTFLASAGAIRLPQAGSEATYTYSLAGHVGKEFTAVRVGGGYQRSLSNLLLRDAQNPGDQFNDPRFNRSVADLVDFNVAGYLGRRVTLDYLMSWSRTDIVDSDETLDTFSSRFSFGVLVSNRILPAVNVWYWNRNETEFTPTASRTRVTASLRFFWDSTPRGRTQQDFEVVRSILPVQRVR